MSAPCTRRWEVEAERDGRLDADASASAARHRSHCRSCREELAALRSLRETLTAEPPPPWDALAEKRLRGKLLAAANEARLQKPIALPRAPAVVAFALAAAIVLAFFGLRTRSLAPAPPAAVASLEITDEGDARYDRAPVGGVEHVHLHAGSLGFVVRHDKPTHLLVHVPDGEIEDLGTTFHVTVRDNVTVRVRVDEGRVLIRKKAGDRDGTVVSAGETWEPAPAVEVPAPPPSAVTPAPAASAATGRSATSAGAPRSTSPARGHTGSPSSTAGAPVAPVTAASSSSAPGADGKKPYVPSEEDVAYMRVVGLLREGKHDAARAAARRYVVLFPSGLRRKEMDVVAE